ncbi:hypothetical protein EAI_03397 [Harpegnathos saltator]|uniref:Uncharacterized protein n=1 Tax=Harpegnathos saltator TaxID=610380 RepID=E2BK02_HARSA|nr:hypothetical protein EAI_03397 [Harpegnathos saltator]
MEKYFSILRVDITAYNKKASHCLTRAEAQDFMLTKAGEKSINADDARKEDKKDALYAMKERKESKRKIRDEYSESTGDDNTHCQANPPVMPSRSRSLRLRCLEGTAGSSGFMGGGPPPPAPLPPPPENNAIPSTRVKRENVRFTNLPDEYRTSHASQQQKSCAVPLQSCATGAHGTRRTNENIIRYMFVQRKCLRPNAFLTKYISIPLYLVSIPTLHNLTYLEIFQVSLASALASVAASRPSIVYLAAPYVALTLALTLTSIRFARRNTLRTG